MAQENNKNILIIGNGYFLKKFPYAKLSISEINKRIRKEMPKYHEAYNFFKDHSISYDNWQDHISTYSPITNLVWPLTTSSDVEEWFEGFCNIKENDDYEELFSKLTTQYPEGNKESIFNYLLYNIVFSEACSTISINEINYDDVLPKGIKKWDFVFSMNLIESYEPANIVHLHIEQRGRFYTELLFEKYQQAVPGLHSKKPFNPKTDGLFIGDLKRTEKYNHISKFLDGNWIDFYALGAPTPMWGAGILFKHKMMGGKTLNQIKEMRNKEYDTRIENYGCKLAESFMTHGYYLLLKHSGSNTNIHIYGVNLKTHSSLFDDWITKGSTIFYYSYSDHDQANYTKYMDKYNKKFIFSPVIELK